MKYPKLIAYIRGMYEESGAKEGGWSYDEIVTDFMRFDAVDLEKAEEQLSPYSERLCYDMGYYQLAPCMDHSIEAAQSIADILA